MRNFLIILSLAIAMVSCSSRKQTTEVTTTPSSVVYTAPSTYSTTTRTTVTRTPLSTGRRVRVTALNDDVSQNLDLNAVAALFGQSATLEAFEQALNKEDGICNLDLNGDGYVDYIRVVEVEEDGNHLVVLQAVLAQDIYQDIATIVAEKPLQQTTQTITYVQIVGDPYIYGRRYVLEPVYIRRPVIFDIFWPVRPVVVYKPYRSPYYWGYMPTYYRPLPPRPMRTYVQQINVFVTNNNYCNHSNYADNVRYSNYGRLQGTVARNDYGTQHPEQSFEQRTTSQGITADNARTINESNRTIVNRTLKSTDKVQFSGGRQATDSRQQGTATGTRQQTTSSGTRQQSTQSSGTRQQSTQSTGTREQSTQSSGTRQQGTATGTRQQTTSTGTREQSTQSSGTRQQSTQSSGTRQQSTQSTGTREQSTQSTGTRKQSTQSSGTRQQSTQSSGTRQQSTQSTTTGGTRSGGTGRR